MPLRRSLSILLALCALTLLVSACGGDDGNEDEADITEAIETSSMGTDPADCTTVQTQQFTEQTEFEAGEAAVTSCEESASETVDDPDSVEVSAVEIDGDTATAEAAFTGGSLDGQALAISLVKEGDQWKLDRIDQFVDFDQAAFAAALADSAAADGETPQQVVDCLRRTVTDADPETVQTAFLSGEEQQLGELLGSCFGG